MYHLSVTIPGQSEGDFYDYETWTEVMQAVNSLESAVNAGIISDFIIWME